MASAPQRKAAYIGAGLDVRPIRALADIVGTFVYIDSRPFCQNPGSKVAASGKQCDTQFVNRFMLKMEAMSFDWNPESIDAVRAASKNNTSCTVEFKRKGTTVRYYMNTAFPTPLPLPHNKEVYEDLRDADMLIVAGYHPHRSVLDVMKKPIDVVCWENTWYGRHDDDSDCDEPGGSVVSRLYENMDGVRSLAFYKKTYVCHPCKCMEDIALLT